MSTLDGVSAYATSGTDYFIPRHVTGKRARILDPLAESQRRLPVGDFRLGSRRLLDDKDVTAGPGSGRCVTGDHLGSIVILAVVRESHEAGSPRIGQQDLFRPE